MPMKQTRRPPVPRLTLARLWADNNQIAGRLSRVEVEAAHTAALRKAFTDANTFLGRLRWLLTGRIGH